MTRVSCVFGDLGVGILAQYLVVGHSRSYREPVSGQHGGHRHEFPPRHCPWTVGLISETMTSLH